MTLCYLAMSIMVTSICRDRPMTTGEARHGLPAYTFVKRQAGLAGGWPARRPATRLVVFDIWWLNIWCALWCISTPYLTQEEPDKQHPGPDHQLRGEGGPEPEGQLLEGPHGHLLAGTGGHLKPENVGTCYIMKYMNINVPPSQDFIEAKELNHTLSICSQPSSGSVIPM